MANLAKAREYLDLARAELEADDEGLSSLAETILIVAREELGNGEEGGNNSGPHVAKYKQILDDGDDDDDGAWCAAYCSWVAEEACRRVGIDLPFKRSQGAKQLGKRIATAGRKLDEPEPGCVVVWDRGKLKPNGKPSWMGHIGFVERIEDGVLHTIEGNVGRYPSKVRRFTHDLSREGRIELFAALEKD
jgi:hypothetical protein